MLHQVQHVLQPHASLADILAQWPDISAELRDPLRHRKPQLAAFFD